MAGTMRHRIVVPLGDGAPSKHRVHGPKSKSGEGKSQAFLWLGPIFLLLVSFWVITTVQVLMLSSNGTAPKQSELYGFFAALQKRRTSLFALKKNRDYCKYEGHCLEGKTCVYNEMSPLGGVCEDYMEILDDSNTALLQECETACQNDVAMDERFYFKFKPIFGKTYMAKPSAGRPDACVVTFERQRHYTKDFDVQEWRNSLKQVLVRLDPYPKNLNQWAALCYRPCTSDSECIPTEYYSYGETPPFVCQQGACQRSRPDWMKNHTSKKDLVIVSGSSGNFFSGLENLAASLRYWAPHHDLVVYNLGMTDQQIKVAESWSNVIAVEWKDGIPKHYPPHVHIGKKYAWKPIIINETLHKYKMIFWTDAGSTITAPLDPLERIIERTGSFLVWGQDTDMSPRAHVATFTYLNKTKSDYKDWPHFAGGIQGHLFPSRYVEKIVKPGAACALTKECIDPDGATLGNHRYDQTVLSILAHSPRVKAWHHTEYLAATKSQLNPNLSAPSDKLLWTARQQCKYYTKLKGVYS